MSERTSYCVFYSCSNCYYSFTVEYRFGLEAWTTAKCPHCGVSGTAKRTRSEPDDVVIYTANEESGEFEL